MRKVRFCATRWRACSLPMWRLPAVVRRRLPSNQGQLRVLRPIRPRVRNHLLPRKPRPSRARSLPRATARKPARIGRGVFNCALSLTNIRMTGVTEKLRQEKKKIAELKIVTDPVDAAEEAGLRYVTDEQPGYTRKRKGKSFVYYDTEGKLIRD